MPTNPLQRPMRWRLLPLYGSAVEPPPKNTGAQAHRDCAARSLASGSGGSAVLAACIIVPEQDSPLVDPGAGLPSLADIDDALVEVCPS